jgi:5-methylcytosine-specific restriction endonuclease McrA
MSGHEREYFENRERVFEIYQGHCVGCGTTKHLTAHHILFRSDGGGDDKGNLVPLCTDCQRKIHQMAEEMENGDGKMHQRVLYKRKRK